MTLVPSCSRLLTPDADGDLKADRVGDGVDERKKNKPIPSMLSSLSERSVHS